MPRNVSFYGKSAAPLYGRQIERDYQTDPRRRMAESILQQGVGPVQSPTEGMLKALQQGVAGYFAGQARNDMKAREERAGQGLLAALQGGQARPWVNPGAEADFAPPGTVATARGPGGMVEGLAPVAGGSKYQQPPAGALPASPVGEESTAPAGGYEGIMAALLAQNNPDLAPFAQQLAMGQMEQQAAQRQAEIARRQGREDYLFQQQNKAFAPKVPMPGRDVPLSDDVQAQRVATAAAGRPRWETSVDEATGLPIQVNSLTGEQKSAPGSKPMTSDQSNAAVFADRMQASEAILLRPEIADAGLDIAQTIKARVPGIGNYLVTPEYRMYDQAKRDFINATLRRESGAAIAESEFENANKQYFPQPGDDPATLAQKAQNRKTAHAGISRAAGPTYKPAGIVPQPPTPRDPTQAEIEAEIARRKAAAGG